MEPSGQVYKERFWVLFLFSLCTCVNACGWICFGPIFGLVELVSNPTVALSSFVVLRSLFRISGLWCEVTDSELSLDELHDVFPALELSISHCTRQVRTESGRTYRNCRNNGGLMDPLPHRVKLPLGRYRPDSHCILLALSLQCSC